MKLYLIGNQLDINYKDQATCVLQRFINFADYGVESFQLFIRSVQPFGSSQSYQMSLRQMKNGSELNLNRSLK